MTSQGWGKYCDGGHYCSAPKECCTLGCCYLFAPSGYRPPPPPQDGLFNVLFLGHWYFWAAVTATVAGILCACSLWKRRRSALCCRDGGRDERASEPDSNGSCYIPPHYSRCSSFHHAPPPYSEVTSKPDLYPLVISYNGDPVVKGNNSASYLMVQYFRNYIVRPAGSLSATSTIDSLSSSFICNAANTMVPPPYSRTESLEEVSVTHPSANQLNNLSSDLSHHNQALQHQQLVQHQNLPRSVSSLTCNEHTVSQRHSHSPSTHSQASSVATSSNNASTHHTRPNSTASQQESISPTGKDNTSAGKASSYLQNRTTSFVNSSSSGSNSAAAVPTSVNSSSVDVAALGGATSHGNATTSSDSCGGYTYQLVSQKVNQHLNRNVLSNDRSVDSESQDEDHNFSELLNLSVCAPSSLVHCINLQFETPSGSIPPSNFQHSYSVANSITGSDISSLANLGTPDSPPRATSPTLEIKELLDKIQQLPQQKSPHQPLQHEPHSSADYQHPKGGGKRSYYNRGNRAKTLYMPLSSGKGPGRAMPSASSSGIFSGGKSATRSWLSRSAPSTPCGNFVPLFTSSQRKPRDPQHGGSHKGSKSKLQMIQGSDGSPLLLNENGDSDENDNERQRDECL